MYLTQEQIDALKQNLRTKHIKLELLDADLKTIDTLEGYAIGGSITANAENPIRRSGSITLAIPVSVNATTFLDQLNGLVINIGGKIWLDKNIKIWVGITNIFTNEIIWYPLGVFLINSPTRNFSSEEFTISFECVDLMAKLTGKRQGQLTGTTTKIEQGHYETYLDNETEITEYKKTELLEAFISTLKLGNVSKYLIDNDIPLQNKYLPYDIVVGVGATVYDILKKLNDLIPTWQMYFDLNGIFRFEPIPTGENSIVYDVDGQTYLSSNTNYSFENVKNQVVVYGRLNSLAYFTENVEYDYTTHTLKLVYNAINPATLIVSATNLGFSTPSNYNTEYINKVEIYNGETLLFSADLVKFENSTNSFGVNYENDQIEKYAIPANEICFLRIFSASLNTDKTINFTEPIICEFMGRQQASCTLVNDNKESAFYINTGLSTPNFYAGVAKPTNANIIGENYELVLNSSESLTEATFKNGTIITFMANSNNVYASGQNFTTATLKNSDVENTTIIADVPLVKNEWENGTRPYLEQNVLANDYTIYQLKYETNAGVEGIPTTDIYHRLVFMGRCRTAITAVFSGGEYDMIKTDQHAFERCLYELYLASSLNENISLGVIPNYLVDVNSKIPFVVEDVLPVNIHQPETYEPYNVVNPETLRFEQFITAFNKNFYVKADNIVYLLTKQITYPLGLDNTPQNISAIKIYENTFF